MSPPSWKSAFYSNSRQRSTSTAFAARLEPWLGDCFLQPRPAMARCGPPIPWCSTFVGLCEQKQGFKAFGYSRLHVLAEADPMVYTEAVEDFFQHLMAQDPGGCHFVQICRVALKEIDQWKAKASAPPAPHPLPRRLWSKLLLKRVPGLCLSGVARPRPAKAGPRTRRGSDGPGDALESKPRPATAGSGPQHAADGPGDVQASEPQPATAGSRPQSPSDKLTDVPLPNESTPPGVQAQRSQIPGLRQKRVRPSRGPGDALESKPRPATAGSRPPRAADGPGDAQASEPPTSRRRLWAPVLRRRAWRGHPCARGWRTCITPA